MKKAILSVAIVSAIILSSCGGGSWNDDSRKKFTDMCEKELGALGEEKAKETCKCSLEKLEKEYKSYEDADAKGNEDKIAEIIKGCAGL